VSDETGKTVAMPAFDTVTEAVAFLEGAGYTDELRLDSGDLACNHPEHDHSLATAIVDHEFRFEGESDPGDEMIVLGISSANGDTKGVLISAFGPSADPEHAEALVTLSHQRRD
jgi:hypothetical protein